MKKAKTATVNPKAEGAEVPVKKWRKIANIVINVFLVVAILFAAACT